MDELETQTVDQEQHEEVRAFISEQLDKLTGEVEEKLPQNRDEKGRFASDSPEPEPKAEEPKEEPVRAEEPKAEEPKDEAQKGEAPKATPQDAPQETPQEPRRNPYSAWKKEAQAELVKLPETVQKFIQERESQFHKGLDQYRDAAHRARAYDSALAPHAEYLAQTGLTPDQVISTLVSSDRILRTGTPEQRAVAFKKLAHDYGIDVKTLTDVPFDAYTYDIERKLAQQQRILDEISQSRQTAEDANLGQTIEQFAQSHEHFDDVRDHMAQLLERGLASSLDDAYEQATWANPTVRSKLLANQPNVTTIRSPVEAAKAARASAVSVKGSPSGVTRGVEAKSTEEAVRRAMAEMGL